MPIPVPENAKAARPWGHVVNMGPPEGVLDKDCGTAEMLIDTKSTIPGFPGGNANRVYYRPNQYELEMLLKGGVIEFVQYGQIVQPFSVAVWPANTEEKET